jgi:3-phosphoshikimate 1-carboxyvinyltransferase
MRRDHIDLHPAARARGTVRVPGSKSISIRVLLLAALSDGETTIDGLLDSDDTTVMREALGTLGVPLRRAGHSLIVAGASGFPRREADVFVGNSGLSIRTLTAALAFADGRYRLHGIARMHARPIGDLVDALTRIGARIDYEATPGFPPLRIAPADLPSARDLHVDASASSQFLTGLLQAAPMLAVHDDLTVTVRGDLISRPYVDMTIALMRRFGVDVRESPGRRFHVARGARYVSPGAIAVEGDASSASCLLAAGLLGGGPVRVEGIPRASLQGDARFVDVLIAMGAQVAQGDDATTVGSPGVASGFRLRAIDADFNDIPDAAMTVAVLALFAAAPCTLRNIGSWRVKETDRLAAMATELGRFGAQVEMGSDWLRVHPLSDAAIATLIEHAVRGEPIAVETYDDHRIAMCFSLVRFVGIPVRIVDPDCVAKTFPDYFERFETLVEPTGSCTTLARTHA